MSKKWYPVMVQLLILVMIRIGYLQMEKIKRMNRVVPMEDVAVDDEIKKKGNTTWIKI